MIFLQFYHYLFLGINLIILFYFCFISRRRMLDAVKLVSAFGFCLCCDYRYYGFSLAQIIMLIAFVIGIGFTHIFRGITKVGGKLRNLLLIYTIYMSSITIIGYLIGKDYRVIGSIFQNELRPVMQISQLVVLMFLVAYATTLDKDSSVEVLELINRAFVLVAVMAVLQWIIYLLFKIDIFPIARDEAWGRVAVSATTSHGFVRATSFVGEPKHLAKFMCIGISFELFCRNYKDNGRINRFRLILYTVCCLMTASATGAIIACAAYGLFFMMKAKKRGLQFIGVWIMVIAAIITLRLPFVYQKIMLNISYGDIPGLENCDTAVVKWLIDKPYFAIFGVGLANAVCFAHEYVPQGTAWIAYYVFTLRRGLILYLAEGGIVGLSMVIAIFHQFYKKTPKKNLYRYEILFLIIMNLFLTVEAISGMQFMLMALVSNMGRDNNDNLLVKQESSRCLE